MAELDYDLAACLRYNPLDGITKETIARVLAVWEGENDGDDWRWVVELVDGRFAFIQGGCDYTGWDCQSWATSVFADTAEQAAMHGNGDVPVNLSDMIAGKGFGQLLDLLSGNTGKNLDDVTASLLRQVADGKKQTWREQTDAALGVTSGKRTITDRN